MVNLKKILGVKKVRKKHRLGVQLGWQNASLACTGLPGFAH